MISTYATIDEERYVAQVDLNVSIEIDYPRQLAETGVIEAEAVPRRRVDRVRRRFRYSGCDQGSVLASWYPEITDVYTLKLTWLDSDTLNIWARIRDNQVTVSDLPSASGSPATSNQISLVNTQKGGCTCEKRMEKR